MAVQKQKSFFDPDGSLPNLPPKPTARAISWHLLTPECPLNKVIVSEANKGNMEMLRLFAHTAFGRHNHSCRGMSFAIYSSAGQGKTYVVRQFAKTIGIPFVFVQSDALVDNFHLLNLVKTAFSKGFPPIVEVSPNHYLLPPCIVFLDEIHALPSKIQDGLLNAMEYNDGIMRITVGKGGNAYTVTVDCHNVCWVGATTEEGKLPGPFASRLETSIVWTPAGPEEIVKIIQHHYPHFSNEACVAVSKYRRVPRGAVAFARTMEWTKDRDNCTWEEAADKVATHMKIDKFGMEKREVAILKALGQRPIAKANLSTVARCNDEALERIVLPPLMEHAGNGPLVVPTHRGFAITNAGLTELDKRGISHKGERVTVEYMEKV